MGQRRPDRHRVTKKKTFARELRIVVGFFRGVLGICGKRRRTICSLTSKPA